MGDARTRPLRVDFSPRLPLEFDAARLSSDGGLLAYREFLDSLPEWPIDLSTALRSALLLAVAVASWLGGAIVERLLGAALD